MDNHSELQSAPSSLQNQQQSSFDSADTCTDQHKLQEDELNHACEVCMAEAWWKMASYQHNLFQQQQTVETGQEAGEGSQQAGYIGSFSDETYPGIDENNSSLPPEFATLPNRANGLAADSNRQADFSMPKLKEFFELQKALGVPNFPENFDDFWLLVVKARLFNVFKYKGPEVYNRIVLKIREVVRKVMAQVEEREAQEQQQQ